MSLNPPEVRVSLKEHEIVLGQCLFLRPTNSRFPHCCSWQVELPHGVNILTQCRVMGSLFAHPPPNYLKEETLV